MKRQKPTSLLVAPVSTPMGQRPPPSHSQKKHGKERNAGPAYPGGGMGGKDRPGTYDIPRGRPAQTSGRVVGGIWPGEGMGLAPRAPTAPGKAARPNLNAAGSVRQNARSPMPTSILNSGRSYYGPLAYSSEDVENFPNPSAKNRKSQPGRSKRGSPGNPKAKSMKQWPVSKFTKET